MIGKKLMLMAMMLLSSPAQSYQGTHTVASPPTIPMPKDALPGNSMPAINNTFTRGKMNRKQRRARR